MCRSEPPCWGDALLEEGRGWSAGGGGESVMWRSPHNERPDRNGSRLVSAIVEICASWGGGRVSAPAAFVLSVAGGAPKLQLAE